MQNGAGQYLFQAVCRVATVGIFGVSCKSSERNRQHERVMFKQHLLAVLADELRKEE